MTMNIALINDSPHWNAQSEYGVALGRTLSERGHKVVYCARAEGKSIRYADEWGVDTIPLGCSTMSFCRDVQVLNKVLGDHVHIVNALGAWSQNISIAALFTHRRSRLVRTRVFIHPVRGDVVQRAVYRRYVSLVVVTNENSKREVIDRLRFPEERVHCIHGGVDIRRFRQGISGAPFREREGIGSAPLVGIVARRSPVKGHKYFLEAAGLVKKRFPEARFLAVGDDDTVSLKDLTAMAEAAGVRRETVFLGYQPDILEVLASLDIGIIASLGSEEHCRIGLEMMAMAKPIVGTRVGAVPEIITDGITGYLADPKDAEGLARGIIGLLSDRNKAADMGIEGRRTVERRFTLDLCAEKTEWAYQSALST